MKQKVIFIVVLAFSFLQSCSLVKLDIIGFRSDYHKVSEQDLSKIVFLPDSAAISNLKNDGKIYAINGKQLAIALQNSSKALVYRWSLDCKSKNCILVSACQKYCTQNNLDLFVVAPYYDMDVINVQNLANRPIFVPNHLYYKIDKMVKYNNKFVNEISANLTTYADVGNKNYSFLFFENGKFVQGKNNLLKKL